MPNYKRLLGFGAMLWIIIFVIISILMFLSWFKESDIRMMVAWWVLEVPVVLLLSKWYFRAVKPTVKNGLILGAGALIVGIILDAVITVPLFIGGNYVEFFGNWLMYVGYVLLLALTTFAGFEFDDLSRLAGDQQ